MRRFFLSCCLLLAGPWGLPAAVAQSPQTPRPERPNYNHGGENWQSKTPPDSSTLRYSVFLIGDVGAPELKAPGEPSLNFMRRQMMAAGPNSTTIYLGDNIYEYGLPEEGAYDRKVSEKRIVAQLDILREYAGEKYMIPGNHDWKQGRTGSVAAGKPAAALRRRLHDARLGRLLLHRRLFYSARCLPRPL